MSMRSGARLSEDLMMLEAEVADRLRERKEEVVALVVARAEQRARFVDEAAPGVEGLGLGFQRGGAVGGDDDFVTVTERNRAQVLAGDHRRVDQHLQGQRLELGDRSRLGRNQRGAQLPSRGQLHRRRERQRARRLAAGIEERHVPLQHRDVHRGGGRCRETSSAGLHQVVEVDGQRAGTGGNLDGEAIHVDRIALPGQRLAVGGKAQLARFVVGPLGPCSPGIHLG
jgi:hypothetical protein